MLTFSVRKRLVLNQNLNTLNRYKRVSIAKVESSTPTLSSLEYAMLNSRLGFVGFLALAMSYPKFSNKGVELT